MAQERAFENYILIGFLVYPGTYECQFLVTFEYMTKGLMALSPIQRTMK